MALELDVADVSCFDAFRESVRLTLQTTWGVTTFDGLVNNAGRLVSHCMRSNASTTLNEHGFEPELIEVALARG